MYMMSFFAIPDESSRNLTISGLDFSGNKKLNENIDYQNGASCANSKIKEV
jgi:hypothetical protein